MEKPTRLVYVAGPYSAPTAWGRKENVRKAAEIGLELMKKGYAVIVPHKNTEDYHESFTSEELIDFDLVMLARCDFAVFVEGWEHSPGSQIERDYCNANGIPAFDYNDTVF